MSASGFADARNRADGFYFHDVRCGMFDLGVWKPQSPPPRPDTQHRIDTTPTKIIALLTKGHVECLKFGVGCRLIPPGGIGEADRGGIGGDLGVGGVYP